MWLRLAGKRSAPGTLELDLVVEPHRVDCGLWLRCLAEQLRAGDRVRVALVLPGAPANDAGLPPGREPEEGGR